MSNHAAIDAAALARTLIPHLTSLESGQIPGPSPSTWPPRPRTSPCRGRPRAATTPTSAPTVAPTSPERCG
ncbi:hypothetical protein OG728_38985 (plasmid) [Streptomyces microflavus]|uniref:hypothetical protein n=1 Tax=Streptomyces microflavus TaxID=1919 RepID=UPI002E13415A|nr:hypothetical protein OG728_38985 [Streptomyces microflavus]